MPCGVALNIPLLECKWEMINMNFVTGQEEHTIQTLKDMLRATLDFKGNWDDQSPLIEFAYNISYHSNIQMALY